MRSSVRCRSFSEQSLVAETMVHDRPRRRVDCISRFAPKSDRRPDDFLADSARLGGNDFFCDLLLSRKCWSILESGMAVNRRSRRPRFYDTVPSRHAGVVDEHAYCDSCRSSRQHVANGSANRPFIADCALRATWTSPSPKTFARRKEYRRRWRDRDSVDSVRGWAGDPS